MPGVKFSEQKQAGYGSKLWSGEKAFSNNNFDCIYSMGYENFLEKSHIVMPKFFIPILFQLIAVFTLFCVKIPLNNSLF